jgi:class 3 adenylate cyclase
MFTDINDSTAMSFSLPNEKFAALIRTIAQEISIAISGYGGYVFKYEGDAVISLFPAEYDQVSACKNAEFELGTHTDCGEETVIVMEGTVEVTINNRQKRLVQGEMALVPEMEPHNFKNVGSKKAKVMGLDCSRAVLEIVRNIINPAFKMNGLPEIAVRTGLAYGFALVVLYGRNLKAAHIDIVGSSISIAAKIASIARPNQILVGEHIYNILLSTAAKDSAYYKNILSKVGLDRDKWKYLSRSNTGGTYQVYEYLETY